MLLLSIFMTSSQHACPLSNERRHQLITLFDMQHLGCFQTAGQSDSKQIPSQIWFLEMTAQNVFSKCPYCILSLTDLTGCCSYEGQRVFCVTSSNSGIVTVYNGHRQSKPTECLELFMNRQTYLSIYDLKLLPEGGFDPVCKNLILCFMNVALAEPVTQLFLFTYFFGFCSQDNRNS